MVDGWREEPAKEIIGIHHYLFDSVGRWRMAGKNSWRLMVDGWREEPFKVFIGIHHYLFDVVGRWRMADGGEE